MSGENTGSIGKAKRLVGIDNPSILKIKTTRDFLAPDYYHTSQWRCKGQGPSIGPVRNGS